jgi:F-type H+-transporting ATPase subunit alpha
VGGNAQIKAMKKVAGSLRLDLSQFRELEAFAKFGSELDPETQRTLARGERLVATLNQPQYAPWPVEEQVEIIFAATQGYLDDIEVERVTEFNEGLRDYLRSQFPEIGEAIRSTKDLSDETAEKLHEAVRSYKADFVGAGEPLGAAEPLAAVEA